MTPTVIGVIAGVMMSGIISDTLNLTGPTATGKDSEILEWLESIVSPALAAPDATAVLVAPDRRSHRLPWSGNRQPPRSSAVGGPPQCSSW